MAMYNYPFSVVLTRKGKTRRYFGVQPNLMTTGERALTLVCARVEETTHG